MTIAAEFSGSVPPAETSNSVLIPVGFDEHDIGLSSFGRWNVLNQSGSETLHALILHPVKMVGI